MWNSKFGAGVVFAAGIGIAVLVAGCSGGTDGGSAANVDYSGSEFVAGEGNTGSIALNINETSLSVAETTGFSVTVVNASGQPVENMRVSCDTEAGLAIVEPNTGSEITDGHGSISGVLGCEAPGSYQIGCRLPVGVNKRQFATVHCSGSVPVGFDGFPGAAGGGLGTGGAGTGTATDGVAITSVTFDDGAEDNTLVIDLAPTLCDEEANTYETWTDAFVNIEVTNNSSQPITFGSLRYTVQESTGTGSGEYTTPEIEVTGLATVSGDGGEATFTFLFMEATDYGKEWVGGSGLPSGDVGLRNIEFELTGYNALGEEVVLTTSQSARFDDYNRCG